jgi:hypothetical protein
MYGRLPGMGTGLIESAFDLTDEYSPQLDSFDYTPDEVAALVNFLGRQGTRKYFASLRDGTEYKVPGVNKTPEDYLSLYREAVERDRAKETKKTGGRMKVNKKAERGMRLKKSDGGKGVDLNNMQKNGRVMKKIEKTLSTKPYKTMENGMLLFTDNSGIQYSVSPDQWSGKVYESGRPAVYLPENISEGQRDRNFQHLVRYLGEMEDWEKSGRQGERPFRFEYMMRSRTPETPELDRNLKPMSVVKEKKGRGPQLIMRSNPNMKTGQEPNYYKVWDEKRKQWSTRPVEPEELEYYRNKNRRNTK